ncbi:prepilin peptidase [Sphingosinicella terrae]|jgi:leader peptidase (prepilin peptidase) / N-methyltransferase|uniref:prepilin peptidase n=1 Tax=Sphingosinicella terrae TaxID=2172047 RepID=UPI000E0DA223|nr:A24 family peptidase [Sphingosinicella terrae]
MNPEFIYQGIGLVFGAILGSFVATLLVRWPQGRSVIAGRSRCDSCGRKLGPGDLVPLLSYAALHGRCRGCGNRIDRRHLAVELTAAMIGLVALLAHPLPLAAISVLLGLWLLLIAALDLQHQWLPDRLTLPLIPLGLVAAWAGYGPPLEERAIGAALGWTTLFLIALSYRRLRGREGMGGGDPKLVAALGAWLGVLQLPYLLLGSGLLGLASVLLMRMRGDTVTATTRLPLGTLLALTAWPIWLVVAGR